ncbi:transcriptional antitermination N peptide [Pectobacterium carotovorum]
MVRDTPVYDSADNVCLPNVWIYNAGHRNNRKDATHIIK